MEGEETKKSNLKCSVGWVGKFAFAFEGWNLIEVLEVHRGKHEAHGKQASEQASTKEHVCYIGWRTVHLPFR